MPHFMTGPSSKRTSRTTRPSFRRRLLFTAWWVGAITVIFAAGALWLGLKASTIKTELEASNQLVPKLKENILQNRPSDASAVVDELRHHTAAARNAATDPLWSLASALPGLGQTFPPPPK